MTHQALATPEVLDRFRASGTKLGDLCVELLSFFGSSYLRTWGFESPPLHDPVAVARVIDPSIVFCVPLPAAIETAGRHTRGGTVVDLPHLSGDPDNAMVATELDAQRFRDLMIAAMARTRPAAEGAKGANQAVACARLGRSVAMVGAVGDDAEGGWMIDLLAAEGSPPASSC